MKFWTFAVSIAFVLLFSACGDEDPKASVELNFRALYGDSPMVVTDKYDYADQGKLFFDNVRFFISDIRLLRSNGNSVSLSEVELINFSSTHTTEEGAEMGNSIVIKDIEPGEYTGISFVFGLTEELNSKQPSDFPSSHPLSDPNPYWSDWGSYIFSTVSGRYDPGNDDVFETGFVYHIGGDASSHQMEFQKNFELIEDATGKLSFEYDLRKVFIRDSEVFDISSINQVHQDSGVMQDLAVRETEAIQLK